MEKFRSVVDVKVLDMAISNSGIRLVQKQMELYSDIIRQAKDNSVYLNANAHRDINLDRGVLDRELQPVRPLEINLTIAEQNKSKTSQIEKSPPSMILQAFFCLYGHFDDSRIYFVYLLYIMLYNKFVL